MKDPCLEIIKILDKTHMDDLNRHNRGYGGQLIKLIDFPLFSLEACWEKIEWQVPEPIKLRFLIFAALNARRMKDTAFAIAQIFARQPDTAFHIVRRLTQEKGLDGKSLWCVIFLEKPLDNVAAQVKPALFEIFEKHATSCFADQFDHYYMTYIAAARRIIPGITLEFLATSERVNAVYRGLGLHFLLQRLPPSVMKSRPVCKQLAILIENILAVIDRGASKTIDLSSLANYDSKNLWVISARESVEAGWRDSLVRWKKLLSKYCAS